MSTPPHISRSFPLLTLAMAVPLVAILAFITYDRYVKDDGPSDGWKAYRNERFKFEIKYPPTWAIERDDPPADLQPEMPTKYTSFIDKAVSTPDLATPFTSSNPSRVFPSKAVAWVNPQGDWCLQRTTETEITVSGVKGIEYVCYWYGVNADNCTPQPGCRDQPIGLMRQFERGGTKFWVFCDVSPYGDDVPARYEVARRVVQSFRFVD